MDYPIQSIEDGLIVSGGIDSYTKLLLHCDGSDASTTFTDSSPAAHTVTPVGNAQIDTAQSKFGGASALFDGNGDALSVASHANWVFPADFTIDGFARFNSIVNSGATYSNILLQSDYAGGGASSGVMLDLATNVVAGGRWYCEFNAGNAITTTVTPLTATWYHFAIIRSGGTINLYVDGTSIGSVSYSGAIVNTNAFRIGHGWNTDVASRYLDGWLDELRVSNGIARWTTTFTAPTRAYEV